MTVKHAHFGGKVDCRALLQDIINNPDVVSVAVVTFDKEGIVLPSWSHMNTSQVALAALVLQEAALAGPD